MANILLVQPNWPTPAKIKDPQKYFPLPFIKLAALYMSHGHRVALVVGNNPAEIPFTPDHICVTTVFSWWFAYVKECIETYHFLFPEAKIEIGGVHASFMPNVYREHFPYANVIEGGISDAEEVEPAWDLLPAGYDTQILRFSQGCIRNCSFCYCHKESYMAYDWGKVSPKIRFRKLILNDNNFLAHPGAKEILKNISSYKVDGKPIASVEIQGGFDVRLLSRDLDFIPLMKDAKVKHVRLAWDGGLEMHSMVETCLEALIREGYHLRDLRCYMLYNHDVPFEVILAKLRYFEKWRLGPIHSRFRPIWLLHDGYIPQKRSQNDYDYYIHKGWTDQKLRIVGSLASDISRMARAGVYSLDEVRNYYGRPSMEDTLMSLKEDNIEISKYDS